LEYLQGKIISNRIEGTIIWYSIDERYGIIRQALSNKTISIDQSQIHYDSWNEVDALCIGQKVSFVINEGSAEDLYLL
jgi:cold shock CspA family protein